MDHVPIFVRCQWEVCTHPVRTLTPCISPLVYRHVRPQGGHRGHTDHTGHPGRVLAVQTAPDWQWPHLKMSPDTLESANGGTAE